MTWIGIGNSFFRRGGGVSWSSYWTTHFVWGLRTIVVDNASIKLDWVNYGNNEVSIERSADGVTYAEIDTVAAGIETFTDTGLDTATDYWYRIRAFKGSNYGDYTSVQADRTLPVSAKYPFVETTNWNNANHAIKDIRLYVPDDSETYYVNACGLVSGQTYYTFKINRVSDSAEVVAVNYNASSYFAKDEWVKVYFSRTLAIDEEFTGYVLINFSLITGGIQYAWTMPANKPILVSSCVIEGDPLKTMGDKLISKSFVISNASAKYAHESQTFALNDKLITVYTLNLDSKSEDHVAQATMLVTTDKTTLLSTEEVVAKDGAVYGGFNFNASVCTSIPRIYKLSDSTIRIYFWYNYKTYYRDYNETTGVIGDVYEFKAIISGGSEPVSLTQANIQAHCEAVSGTTDAEFNSLNFVFRDIGSFFDIGDGKYYAVGEFLNDKPGSATTYIPVFMESADGGITWTLIGIAYQAEVTVDPISFAETNLIYDSGVWYFLCRNSDYNILISKSIDDGKTWSKFDNIIATKSGLFPQSNYGLRNGIIKSGNNHILAYSHRPLAFRNAGNERSCAAISFIRNMSDGNNVRAILDSDDLIHYLSVIYDSYDNCLYVSYTTGEKPAVNPLKNTIRVVKIALADL